MSESRTFDMTLEIAVPADGVWQALTTAEELVRWFPLEANITPGKGGTWMISWDGRWPWSPAIEIWEPPHRLRLVDRTARPYDAQGNAQLESVAPLPISIDWHLEAKGGTTTLRLVHAGFGRGGAWDDEYEGVSVGWRLELNGLKHYLERHRGEDRRVTWNRIVMGVSPEALWPRFIGAEGIVPEPLASLSAGDRFDATLSTGDAIRGTVGVSIPGRAIQVMVDNWNEGLYRIWIDRIGHESTVNSSLSAYGMPESFVTEFGSRMEAEIGRIASAAVPA
jgi:uncharacterized protein YndB with AHSA1/START domain